MRKEILMALSGVGSIVLMSIGLPCEATPVETKEWKGTYGCKTPVPSTVSVSKVAIEKIDDKWKLIITLSDKGQEKETIEGEAIEYAPAPGQGRVTNDLLMTRKDANLTATVVVMFWSTVPSKQVKVLSFVARSGATQGISSSDILDEYVVPAK